MEITEKWQDPNGLWHYKTGDVHGIGATYISSVKDWNAKMRKKIGIYEPIQLTTDDLIILAAAERQREFDKSIGRIKA